MKPERFLCKKLRAASRARRDTNRIDTEQNITGPSVEQEAASIQQPPEQNRTGPQVEEAASIQQPPEQNRTGPQVEQEAASIQQPPEQNRTGPQVEQEAASIQQPPEQNRTGPQVEEAASTQQTTEQNRTGPPVEQEAASTQQPPEQNRTGPPVEHEAASTQQTTEQNRTGPPVKHEAASTQQPTEQNRNGTPVAEGALKEPPSEQNRNGPPVAEAASTQQPTEQNRTGTEVEEVASTQQTTEQNRNGTPFAEGELGEQITQKNGTVQAVEPEGQLRKQRPQQNGTVQSVEQSKIPRKPLVNRKRTLTQDEEDEWSEKIAEQNGIDASVKRGKKLRIKPAKQNVTDGTVKGKILRKPLGNRKRAFTQDEKDDSRRNVTSDRRNDIVDLHALSDRLWCFKCNRPISLKHITSTEVNLLVKIYTVPCQECEKTYRVPTSAQCPDYIPKTLKLKEEGSKSEAKESDLSATPSTSQGNASSSVATSAAEISKETPKVEYKYKRDYIRVEGRRIVDLQWLATKLWCANCKCPLSLRHVIEFRVEGLVVIFRVHCRGCDAEFEAETSKKEEGNENRYKINVQVLESIEAHSKEGTDIVFKIMNLELERFEPSPQEN